MRCKEYDMGLTGSIALGFDSFAETDVSIGVGAAESFPGDSRMSSR